jgi:drug/metabolite transporter (DMT)-like permease
VTDETTADLATRPSSPRLVLGLLGVSLLIGAYTWFDSSSLPRALVAALVGLPLLGVALLLMVGGEPERRASALRTSLGVGCIGLAVVVVPLAVGGRFPRRGSGEPAPDALGLVGLALATFAVGALLGWWAWRASQRNTP